MMRRILTGLLSLLCFAAAGLGQSPIIAPYMQTQELDIITPQLPPVIAVTCSVVGGTGNSTFWYWVVANYPEGNATPSFPVLVTQAPNTLSASNYVQCSWATAPRAATYDLLRTVTPALPNGAASIAVATAQVGTTVNDQGGALSLYTVNTLPGNQVIGRFSAQANGLNQNNVTIVSLAPFASESAAIAACVVNASVGTVCDARGLLGPQTWSSDPFNGTTKQITLMLGPSTVAVQANTTIPANVTVQFSQGSVLSAANGVTLNVNGSIIAPPTSQIFSSVGTGVVYLNSGQDAWVEWFGAKGDNSTDSTAAINNAFAALKPPPANLATGRLLFHAGTYLMTNLVTPQLGVSVQGSTGPGASGVAGYLRTSAAWTGAAGGTMFSYPLATSGGFVHQTDWRDIQFDGRNAAATIFSFTTGDIIDYGTTWWKCSFANTTGDAIVVNPGVNNFYMYDFRADNIGGYFVHVTQPPVTGVGGYFRFDNFTYDTGATIGHSAGFLFLDGATAPNNLVNRVEISNAKFEYNGTFAAGSCPQLAFICLGVNTANPAVIQQDVFMHNVGFNSGVGLGAASVISITPQTDHIRLIGIDLEWGGPTNLSLITNTVTTFPGNTQTGVGPYRPLIVFAPSSATTPGDRSLHTGAQDFQVPNGATEATPYVQFLDSTGTMQSWINYKSGGAILGGLIGIRNAARTFGVDFNPSNSGVQPSANIPWFRIVGGGGHGLGINSGSATDEIMLGPDNAAPVIAGFGGGIFSAATSLGMGYPGKLLCSATAPTISSGFGTSPSISTNNGTCSFTVTIGTGGTASTGVIGLATAISGWNVYCEDITTFSTTVFRTRQTASTLSTVTIGNFGSAATAQPWTAGDVLTCSAFAR